MSIQRLAERLKVPAVNCGVIVKQAEHFVFQVHLGDSAVVGLAQPHVPVHGYIVVSMSF
jgi:hypothetical protein